MIEIDIKLVPFGFKDTERNIGKIKIVNVATYKDKSDYSYSIVGESWQGKPFDKIEGMIIDHNRSEHIFSLVKKILDKEIK